MYIDIMIGSKQIDKIMCIACQNLIGEHSKRGLGRCLFRVQGTMIAEGKNQAEESMNKYKAPEFVPQENTKQ